jgi:hypothetical protein
MTTTQVEVITSTQPRRRWSPAEKGPVVGAAPEPGAVASGEHRAVPLGKIAPKDLIYRAIAAASELCLFLLEKWVADHCEAASVAGR